MKVGTVRGHMPGSGPPGYGPLSLPVSVITGRFLPVQACGWYLVQRSNASHPNLFLLPHRSAIGMHLPPPLERI